MIMVDSDIDEIGSWNLTPITFLLSGAPRTKGSQGKDLVVFMEDAISVRGNLLSETMQGRISRKADASKLVEVSADDIEPALDFRASELASEISRRR